MPTKVPPRIDPARYDAVVRPNGRGGYEIASPATPVGDGEGNYDLSARAYAIARYNFDAARILVIEDEPAARPSASSTLNAQLSTARRSRRASP